MKAIVLDFDGLILDTETPLFTSWQELCQQYGVSMDPAWWANILTAQADPPEAYAYFEQNSPLQIDRSQLHEVRSARETELIAGQTVMPGVLELLSQAVALSMPIAIASNSDRAWVTRHLTRLGLLSHFTAIKCRDDVPNPKPYPDLYLAVLAQLGVPPSKALAFEDSPVGVKAAKTAGVFCIAVPNPVTSRLSFADADIVVPSLLGFPLQDLVNSAAAANAAA